MSRASEVRDLGALGERLVLDWFKNKGSSATATDDWYDTEKDMTVDGKTVEVKTLLPIYKYNSFCLESNQSQKCDSVDRLIFVRIPDTAGDPIYLYESVKDEDGKRDFFKEFFNGSHCRFYRLTLLENLDIIHNEELSQQLWDLSPSSYKGVVEHAA